MMIEDANAARQATSYLSPDCRDGNHQKCDTVAWDPETDNYTTCGCGCQHYGTGPE